MGTFRHPVELSATAAGPFVMVQAVVDTGATDSLLPRPLLTQLGVVPHNKPRSSSPMAVESCGISQLSLCGLRAALVPVFVLLVRMELSQHLVL